MFNKESDFDGALNQAVSGIRSAEPDAGAEAQAAARVWASLRESAESGESVAAGCEHVRALLPSYQAGTLPEAREWLVQDHLRECPDCRHFAAGSPRRAVVLPWRETNRAAAAPVPAGRRYAWAAAVVAAVGLGAWVARDNFLPAPEGDRASVEWVDGTAYLVTSAGQRSLQPGAAIGDREWVRTSAASRAMLKLRDGSRVEMSQLAEVGVGLNRRDTTVHLERGAVIVQAAKRREGHLYVTTRDASVAVTGTVFSVNSGVKGTRVSVLEGEVHVNERGRNAVLHAGDQVNTSASLHPVAMREEIGWSRNRDEHLKLLAELSDLAGEVKQVQLPGLRYQSRLLNALPAGTVVFASLPNLGEAIAQAHQIFEDRMRERATLREWWEKEGGSRSGPALEDTVRFVRTLSGYLGDEVVIAVSGSGDRKEPVMIAEVRRSGLREFIESEFQRLNVRDKPAYLVTDTMFAVSPDEKTLAALQLTGGLAQQPFGQRIAAAYQEGVSFLFCADLESMSAGKHPGGKSPVENARYIVVQQREYSGDHSETRATLNFAGARQGVASWLASPAPMGSLDFVSPNATFAAAFVVKSPQAMVDDLIALAGNSSRFREHLQEAETKTGVRLREDLAASLGNDVTLSVDGPLLPTPAWKAVIEVRDPARVQSAIERLVEAAKQNGDVQLTLGSQEFLGRKIWVLKSAKSSAEILYAFTDGYAVFSPNMDAMQRSLRAKDGGWRLVTSHRFRSLLPRDSQTYFSALVYHNLTDIGALLGDAANAAGNLPAEQRAAVERMAANAKPGLLFAYGFEDRIQVATAGGGLFGVTVENLLNVNGIGGLMRQAQLTRASRSGYRMEHGEGGIRSPQ